MIIIKYIFLFIPACVYGFISKIRNYFFDKNIFRSKQYDIPIICIGNISVGGTGKTPHTEFLIRLLKEDNNVAILSRGYKRKTKGFHIVETNDNYKQCGDEALQIKQKFNDITVCVCENRCIGVEKILEKFPETNCIILDDGFQHRQLKASYYILLNNYNRQYKSDFYIPFGRLRDNKSSAKRADIIIFTKCPEILTTKEKFEIKEKYQTKVPIVFSKIKYNKLINVFDKENIIELTELKRYNVLLITGIAENKNLKNYIEKNSKSISLVKYSDHYAYKESDINNIIEKFLKIEGEKIIIITEKDSKKIINFGKKENEFIKNIYYIPIEIEISDKEENNEFINNIKNHVRKN